MPNKCIKSFASLIRTFNPLRGLNAAYASR